MTEKTERQTKKAVKDRWGKHRKEDQKGQDSIQKDRERERGKE